MPLLQLLLLLDLELLVSMRVSVQIQVAPTAVHRDVYLILPLGSFDRFRRSNSQNGRPWMEEVYLHGTEVDLRDERYVLPTRRLGVEFGFHGKSTFESILAQYADLI